MSETKYTVVYVSDDENGAPRLSREDRPGVSTTTAESVLDGTHRGTVGQSGYLWVAKAGTPAHEYLREHAAGRISSFSAFSAKEWLPKVVADPEFLSYPAEDVRPAVKATGLGSTDNGKKATNLADNTSIPTVGISGPTNISKTLDAIDKRIEVTLKSLPNTSSFATGGFAKEPAKPHSTLITQVDVGDVSPVNDTLYNALEASKLEGMYGDQFPEDGNITIQWSKVHGRTNLRKFTITVDYKESN